MLHDLAHPIRPGMTAYPGDPPVRIVPWPEAAPRQVSAVSLGSHTGTHMDAPRHLDPAGRALSDYAIGRFVGPGILLDATGAGENEALPANLLNQQHRPIVPRAFVLVRTGWDRYWHDERYFRHPFLSSELAGALIDLGTSLIGLDALSVDSSVAGGDTAHRALLGVDVLVVENLRGLSALDPARPYQCVFAPLALDDCDGVPVRALAMETDESKADPVH